MQNLLIITPIFILCSACLAWVLYQMIQPGQLLEAWQGVLDRAYKVNPLLEMFLGGCYKCFSNFISQITFIIYLVCQYHIHWMGWWNVAIYFAYPASSIVIAMLIDKALQNDTKLEERIQELENKVEQI